MTLSPGDPTDPETLSRRKAFRGRGQMPTRLQRVGAFLRQNEWFWAAFFLVLLLAVFTRHFRVQPPPSLPVGSAAPRDIRAPFDLQIEDRVATDQRKAEARAKVLPVYDWDSGSAGEAASRVASSFATARANQAELDRYFKGEPDRAKRLEAE